MAGRVTDGKVVSPLVDFILTAAFAGLLVFGLKIIYQTAVEEFLLFIFFTFALFPGIRFIKYVFGELGRIISSYLKRSRGHAPLGTPLTMKKWKDQSWQFVIHVSMTLLETYVLSSEVWWEDTTKAWSPPPQTQEQKTSLKMVYLIQMAIWTVTAFFHRFLDERRHDYVTMYIHHIVTMALLVGSYSSSYLRIGLLVLYVHDISDITVDLLKLTNYLGLDGAKNYFILEITFVVNLCCWIYWRLYEFPTRVISCVWFDAGSEVAGLHVKWGDDLLHYISTTEALCPFWFPALLLLCILLVLHVWWTFLFLRIAARLLKGEDPDHAQAVEYEVHSRQGSAQVPHNKKNE